MSTSYLKNLFWLLPYNLRYHLFSVVKYKKRKNYEKMKEKQIGLVSFRQFVSHKTIFIHIPKAAGISFNTALFSNHGGGHIPLRNYQFIFNEKEFNEFFKFTIVRNPWDRLFSAYNFLTKGGMTENDKLFSEENILPYKTFEDFVLNWVNKDNIKKGIHFLPQHNFICDIDGKVLIDYIGYFEKLDEEYDFLSKRLGITGQLKKLNVQNNSKNSYKDNYTKEMKEKVAEVYKRDIEMFKYEF